MLTCYENITPTFGSTPYRITAIEYPKTGIKCLLRVGDIDNVSIRTKTGLNSRSGQSEAASR